MTQFELLVHKMRNRQIDYFLTRDAKYLRLAKALEKEVDDHIQNLFNDSNKERNQPFQQDLFNEFL